MALTRRDFLRYSAGATALGTAVALTRPFAGLAAAATSGKVRAPGSLPHPHLPAGTVNEDLPFTNIVVVMMENHSFDNYLGVLAANGKPRADGLTLNGPAGLPTNSNPDGAGGVVPSYALLSTAQDPGVSQSWDATHAEIDGGKMDGFVTGNGGSIQSMGYWDPDVLPFAYSLASTFPIANRWFCSAPCQTYPNRRFLMAGTAYGDIATDTDTIWTPTGGFAAAPPNGTIFDQLDAYGISWANYFTDLPQTAVIPTIIEKYPSNIQPIAGFLADCAAGTLPSVSFVDPEFGALSDIGSPLTSVPGFTPLGSAINTMGGDEEDPQDLAYGENWAYFIINAVLQSRQWPQTLLIYTYDEHGGYYDHVPPPAAIAPDDIPPDLQPGGYTIYGPRVPTVVASPFARAGAVSNVVHDHTSVLATIEAKWNLPALTYRDANAATVADFLDTRGAFLSPPTLAQPQPFLPEMLTTLEGLG